MKPYIKEGDNLKIAVMELRLYAPWVHSLKEKRMVVKSLLGKIRSRYAVSAAETGEQDIHQTIVIGVAAIVAHAAQADGLMDDAIAERYLSHLGDGNYNMLEPFQGFGRQTKILHKPCGSVRNIHFFDIIGGRMACTC